MRIADKERVTAFEVEDSCSDSDIVVLVCELVEPFEAVGGDGLCRAV
jgi:hypothetical protein